MPLMQFIGSLIAVTIVAWMASRLFRNPNKLTIDRVMQNTARYCPHLDLEATASVIISETGGSAAVILEEGFALLTTLGDRVVVREVTPTTKIKATKTNTGLMIDIDDFTLPKIEMRLNDTDCKSLLRAIQYFSKTLTEPLNA